MDERGKLWLGLAAAGVGAWLLARRVMRASYDFRDKVVLITGGSRGLGLVMARMLADEGARLALLARDRDTLDRAAADLAGHGCQALTLPCDVADAQGVQDAVRAVEVHLGPVDVLINDAGLISVGPLATQTREDFEREMNVNFWGVYNAVEAVLPSMRQRGQGRIVNISSIGGKVSVPHMLPYTASKYALLGYSRGLRIELAQDGITVTTVCPGLMRTGSPPQALFKGQHEKEYAWFAISDSLPLLTTSAESAASAIIEACRRGEAEVTLTVPAQVAALVQALFPDLTAALLTVVNRLLPGPGNGDTTPRKGLESQSALAPSLLTALTDRAARFNNELG